MVFTHAVDFLEDFFLSIGPGDEPKFPHVPVTLRSVWYLTPRQHAMETVAYVTIFAPMCYVALKQALNHSKWKNQRPIRAPTALDGVLGAITMSSFLGVSGRYEYIGSPSWILFGFTVIALYHAIVLQLACLVTEVNIATLMSPPNVLRSLGEWYRPAQYGMCFVLHWVHNLSITGFVAIASSSKVLKPLLSPKQH
ncbi:hypothetical protein DYB37_000445 [Aphanomyces astaci]|uniref:Uncharacterized protein n=1 Tax=Aphanomyces astaci TaxID=112090 RepID=A0A3R6Y441_APHAT|nr:hypothetical protein DYB35_000305 [Aphanomyces astaci]RHZ20471.1 hypothetical protein DYB37_000445 [Aphanomyces astaci]